MGNTRILQNGTPGIDFPLKGIRNIIVFSIACTVDSKGEEGILQVLQKVLLDSR